MSDGAAKRKTASTGFHFLAGLGSGCTTAFLLQPADLLKTRVQQSRSSTLSQALRTILDGPSPIRQLWRGTTPSVIRTGFGSALYFGMLNSMRTYAAKLPTIPVGGVGGVAGGPAVLEVKSSSSVLPKLGNLANGATGALARVAAGFVMNPVTVLKVRYESSYYAYTSLLGAGRDIMAKEGFRGFFAGFGATAVRDAPYAGLYVLVYEQAKARLHTVAPIIEGVAPVPSKYGALGTNFLSGVIAAVSATTLTNPFDAIKTRLQLMPAKYGNMVKAGKMMLREEGVRSMFDGLSLRIGRKALSSALAWTVYEELIRRAQRAAVV
nr:Solute carrier family 25 member 38 [Rachicladosporium sp. CCFEE 5018]